MSIRYVRWVAVLGAAATLTACGGGGEGGAGGDQSGPLKIGVINPFSGNFALYGEEVTRGYQLAVDEVNGSGGVGGRQVELLRGDASTPDQAITQAERLTTREEVDLLTGTYISSVASPASDVAARSGTFYWETNATADDLTERDLPGFMRFGPRASDFAQVSAQVMPAVTKAIGKDIRGATVYIEHEDSSYGSSIAKQQEKLLKAAGARVVGNAAHAADATDLSDSVLKAKRADPDVWLITGYVPDTNLLLRSAASQGFDPETVLTGTGDTNETLESVGKERLSGTFVVSYPSAEVSEQYAPGADRFLASYRTKYKSAPRAPQSLTAYAGMRLLLQTLKKDPTTEPEALRKTLQAIDEPDSSQPSGFGVRFDGSGQNQRAKPVVVQWRDDGTKDTVFPARAAGSNRIEAGATR